MKIPYLTLDEAYEAMVASTGKTEAELLGYDESNVPWTANDDWD